MLGAYRAATRDPWQDATPRTRRAYARVREAIQRDGFTLASAFGVGGWMPSHEGDPYASARELFDAARRARVDGFPVRVSDVNHGKAFLGCDATNLAFRAHHDAMHVIHALGFSFKEECQVARLTVSTLALGHLDRDARAVIAGEIIGQGLYHNIHGTFPLTAAGDQPCYHVTPASVHLGDLLLDMHKGGEV